MLVATEKLNSVLKALLLMYIRKYYFVLHMIINVSFSSLAMSKRVLNVCNIQRNFTTHLIITYRVKTFL